MTEPGFARLTRGKASRGFAAWDAALGLGRTLKPLLRCHDARDWRSQFAHPRGWRGRLAGALMARKNAGMNGACVELLDVKPEDRVLEVGFGHGRTVAWLAERATRGLVAGVDPSGTMLRQATRRNRRAIAAGRVRLELGEATRLPFADAGFDRALASNCVQFWGDLPGALAELARVLAPGGTLLVGMRVHDPKGGRFASPGFREAQIDAVRRAVEHAGFTEVRLERRRPDREVAAVIAVRPR